MAIPLVLENIWISIGRVTRMSPLAHLGGRCGGHVAVHGRDKYLTLLACGERSRNEQVGEHKKRRSRPGKPSLPCRGRTGREYPHSMGG
jgi:hypothetical protein